MVKMMIPPNSDWFNPSTFFCLPPNNCLIYGAMTKIVHIPPEIVGQENAEIKTIDLKTKLLGFSPNPNWTNSKRLAVIDANLTVTVVNFETGEATHGHRAHETGELRDKSKKVTAAIVFLQQNAVVSSVRSTVAHYCLNTNKYRLYFDFTQPGNPFSIFRQSPKDPDLLAGGTKDGLVVIISLGKMQVIRKFRGHDKEISSMDWRYLSLRPTVEDGKAKTLEQDISLTDPTDAFDLYDHSEAAEFGVYGGSSVANKSDDKEDNNRSLQEKLVSDEGFDFSEACRSVKRDLEASQNKQKDNGSGMPPCTFYGGGDQSKTTFEDNKDKYGVRNPNEDASDNDSLLSNASSNTPDLTEESLNDEAAGPSKDKVPEDQIPVLATGSKEHHANVWDVLSDEVQPMVTMKWNSKTKSPFPEAYTNIMFLRDNVILIGNGFGEIEEYKIEFNPTTRKIVVKEKKAKNFDVKAVLSMAPSAGGDILWTSSIYRNISCFDIPRNYAKIVSLDTIQPRIHCITPNPHDPNILAVGGCDNRVCLWNTSEVQSHSIKMRPFMTKIRAALLCIAWHPDLEQLVAFSTKEGRVATLDTSRPNNVPKPLKHYTNGDVYSITWAKLQGSPILICAHNKELVFYSFTTACGKSEVTKHSVADIVCVTSLVASGNVLVVGTGDGRLIIVDINNRFNILDERILTEAKYIGMMEWFEDALAVATDHDIYMVRNIKKNIGLSRDPTGEQDIALLPNQHTQRINSVSFNRTGNLLISTCNGGLVKILDVDKEPGFEETIATINLGSPAFCAIFLPSNQDLVVCGGQDCTPTIFKWEDFRGNEEKPLPKKKADPHRKVHWARQSEAANKGDKKLKVRVEDVEQSFGNMQLDPPTSSAPQPGTRQPAPKKKTSIFDLINKEIFDGGLHMVRSILKNADHSEGILEKMFASREGVIALIEKERAEKLGVGSSQTVVYTQLRDELMTEVSQRTIMKTLTETHVAVAPSVSYDFWKTTCQAYAIQCAELGEPMAAAPFFLALSEEDSCIEALLEGKYFREAFVVAKMRKLDENPILSRVVTAWSNQLITNGQFEAAATVLVCFGNYGEAIAALNRRQKKDDLVNECIQLLRNKTGM